MKCLILGGAGFIGSHLAEGLLQAGHQVRIFDRPNVIRPPTLTADDRVEWLDGDFGNEEDVARVLEAVPRYSIWSARRFQDRRTTIRSTTSRRT